MLKNSLTYLILWMMPLCISGQEVEAESRPYRFSIDVMLKIEDVSASQKFKILPYKVVIGNLLQEKIRAWYSANEPSLSNRENTDQLVFDKVDELLPDAIQQVGLEAFSKSQMECYLMENTLQLKISHRDFKPFNVAIPLIEIEDFINHFNHIEYSKQQFALNKNEEFVVTHLQMFNPANGKKYIFYNTEDQSVEAPSFSVSIPKTEL